MSRIFSKNERGERIVLASVNKFHIYHPECAPPDSYTKFVKTEKAQCAGCFNPIWKKGNTLIQK